MKKIIAKIVRKILGIKESELPNAQMKYIKDLAKKQKKYKVDEDNLIAFIDSLKEKHSLEEISLFRKGVAIFSSEQNELETITKIHETFIKTKPFIENNIMMLKDKMWISIFEKENFVFIIKKFAKPNEFELNAISYDVLNNLDKVLMEEKQIMEKIYNKMEYI